MRSILEAAGPCARFVSRFTWVDGELGTRPGKVMTVIWGESILELERFSLRWRKEREYQSGPPAFGWDDDVIFVVGPAN